MENVEIINAAFKQLRYSGIAKSQREFARLLDVNESTVSKALKGDEGYLSPIMMSRINALMIEKFGETPQEWGEPQQSGEEQDQSDMLTVIPTEAMAGTLVDFCASINEYECERMVSPIKGAQYCIKVCGDSMWPEIPNGSQILLKKIMEEQFVEWGKIYCLDTENGPVVKKIYPTDDPQIVECRSTNPDYPPFRINTQYIIGWYRVLMVLALK